MANKIQAVSVYRPKIKLGKTVSMKQLVKFIAGRTGLNEGEISIVLKELRDGIIFNAQEGRGTKIDGLGTYLPKISLDGRFDISHRLDPDIRNGLNIPGMFNGEIENRQNVGKTADDLVVLWNEAHPEDPVS